MIQLIDINPVVKYTTKNLLGGKDYVVGDLHGCYHMLSQLLDEIKFDYDKDRLFSVGDLVDRGLYSEKCLDLLSEKWFFAVLGNHEDMIRAAMVQFLRDNNAYYGPVLDWHNQECNAASATYNGGEWLQKILLSKFLSLEAKIDYCKRNIEKINELPLVYAVGEGLERFNVVHSEIGLWADVATDEKLDQHADQFVLKDFVWARGMFMYNKEAVRENPDNFQSEELSITFSGHTPVERITKIARQINIDTCAFYADFISDERNGDYGLTIVEPYTYDFWHINGATKKITASNLTNDAILNPFYVDNL